jgi:hypothetical protein
LIEGDRSFVGNKKVAFPKQETRLILLIATFADSGFLKPHIFLYQ